MPGHHPHGEWISTRAKHIAKETKKEYGPEKGKSVAYALAAQQAHTLNKSPKGFRTPEGVAEAKSKYNNPKEYKKTASVYLQAYSDEFCKIARFLLRSGKPSPPQIHMAEFLNSLAEDLEKGRVTQPNAKEDLAIAKNIRRQAQYVLKNKEAWKSYITGWSTEKQ